MKIIYISSIAYSDVDISMLIEAQKKYMDITYVGVLHTNHRRSCAIDLRSSQLVPGLNKAVEIPELNKYRNVIDLSKAYIFCSNGDHAYSYKTFKGNHQLYRFIVDNEFDVVHLTSVPSFLNPFMFFLRKKIIVTIHDPIPHSSATYQVERYNRLFSFKYIRNLILLNKSQTDEFIQSYNVSKKTRIYGSILSCYTYLRMYEDKPDSTTKPYILFFGNVTGYKGLDILFPAMKLVHDSCPELRLIAAGGGKYNFDITAYQKSGYIDIRNEFIPDDELAQLISNCEFVVVPYIDATQSGVVMSAYAFNKPCIATNVGGLPEMVIDKEYGLIVNPGNITELSKAIIELHNNSDLNDFFSSNICRDYQNGDKSWNTVCKQLDYIYKNIH